MQMRRELSRSNYRDRNQRQKKKKKPMSVPILRATKESE